MATHVAEAHGGENGVGGGGTPDFRRNFCIGDGERKAVKADVDVWRRAARNKRSSSDAQQEGRSRTRARTSSGGAGRSSSAQGGTRRSDRAPTPSAVAGAIAAFMEEGGGDVRSCLTFRECWL